MIFGNIKVLESCACLHWSPSLLGSVVLVSCLMAQGAIALVPPFYLLALSTRMSTSPSWFPNNHSQLVIRASKPCSSTMKPLYQPVRPWSPCPCSKPETFVVSIYQSVAMVLLGSGSGTDSPEAHAAMLQVWRQYLCSWVQVSDKPRGSSADGVEWLWLGMEWNGYG